MTADRDERDSFQAIPQEVADFLIGTAGACIVVYAVVSAFLSKLGWI